MTFQLNLPPKLLERLRQEAERRGEPVEAAVLRLLEERLPPILPLPEERAAALRALFQQ